MHCKAAQLEASISRCHTHVADMCMTRASCSTNAKGFLFRCFFSSLARNVRFKIPPPSVSAYPATRNRVKLHRSDGGSGTSWGMNHAVCRPSASRGLCPAPAAGGADRGESYSPATAAGQPPLQLKRVFARPAVQSRSRNPFQL